ncbi:hypothetical protein HA050_07150 [Iodobacter sp. HSC-16F04]|uniref:Uncharacterized protein n=1 Tax=Iodobacter violaceini TaxID=3044271 RepID=A0ABX0L058_9NEIS|nr:hypothetical protein [Iodobacter violacea]NHQ85893.1 hypothetical protein [Iodobacter violacea]
MRWVAAADIKLHCAINFAAICPCCQPLDESYIQALVRLGEMAQDIMDEAAGV